MNTILHFSAVEEVLKNIQGKSEGKTFLYGKLFLNLPNERLVRGVRSCMGLNNWYPIPPALCL